MNAWGNGRGVGLHGADPVPHRALGPVKFFSDFPIPEPRTGAQLHGFGDNFHVVGPAAGKLGGQEDVGDFAAAAPGPAWGEPPVLNRDPESDDPRHPEAPGPQPARAYRTHKFTAQELGFDSGRIVAYGEQ